MIQQTPLFALLTLLNIPFAIDNKSLIDNEVKKTPIQKNKNINKKIYYFTPMGKKDAVFQEIHDVE